MSKEITSPLAGIVAKMAKREIKGEASELRERVERARPGVIVLLVDVSGSMCDVIGDRGLSKFEHLKMALADIRAVYPSAVIVAFASRAKKIESPADLPDPRVTCPLGGGTDLAYGIECAAEFRPTRTIVITDGLPDNDDEALDAARLITGIVETIFCGPDGDSFAVSFLRKLSRDNGGTHVTWDGYHRDLTQAVRGLLPAPNGL